MEAKTAETTGALLKSQERATLQMIAVSAEPPYSQRALAILGIDGGLSQKDAADKTGLTPRQVRYWLEKFCDEDLAIFPESVLPSQGVMVESTGNQETGAQVDLTLQAPLAEASAQSASKNGKEQEEKKGKKAKKDNKPKKKKKAKDKKKDKKSKGKKSKKGKKKGKGKKSKKKAKK